MLFIRVAGRFRPKEERGTKRKDDCPPNRPADGAQRGEWALGEGGRYRRAESALFRPFF